jgi:hypothetical protein
MKLDAEAKAEMDGWFKMQNELALLREVEQAARTVQEKHKREHISGETCVCPVCIALATVDTFRKEKP